MKYVVQHPNADIYLKLLDKPVVKKDSFGDGFSEWSHDWVDHKKDATQFDTEQEARNNYTSPLCDTVAA